MTRKPFKVSLTLDQYDRMLRLIDAAHGYVKRHPCKHFDKWECDDPANDLVSALSAYDAARKAVEQLADAFIDGRARL